MEKFTLLVVLMEGLAVNYTGTARQLLHRVES